MKFLIRLRPLCVWSKDNILVLVGVPLGKRRYGISAQTWAKNKFPTDGNAKGDDQRSDLTWKTRFSYKAHITPEMWLVSMERISSWHRETSLKRCRRHDCIGYVCSKIPWHRKRVNTCEKFWTLTIADIQKARWQIERFFKEIKQNLRIKSFVAPRKMRSWTRFLRLSQATCSLPTRTSSAV